MPLTPQFSEYFYVPQKFASTKEKRKLFLQELLGQAATPKCFRVSQVFRRKTQNNPELVQLDKFKGLFYK